MNILNAAEIRKVEDVENETGIPFLKLMSLAGNACTRAIMEAFPADQGKVVVVCGKGKNGGDGFVIARKLLDNDYDVSVVLAFGNPTAGDAQINYEKALEAGVPVFNFSPDPHYAQQVIANADLIVDAIFGIGFHGAANEDQAEVFDLISRSRGLVVAIDVPSGVNTDTGEVEGAAVKADATLAISCLKPAHVLFPAREFCGETLVLDIGISEASFSSVDCELQALNHGEVADLLPKRKRTAHKNDFGHVLVIGGSRNMPGAACLASNAALRMGAGLVTVAFPESAYSAFGAQLSMEIMRVPVAETKTGQLTMEALPDLFTAMKKATVIVLGPGLGTGEAVEKVIAAVLEQATVPVVLDADGLNAVAKQMQLLKDTKAPLILTPHLGEFARLTGKPVAELKAHRKESIRSFVEEYKVTLLLKGADTLVTSFQNEKITVNTTGNQGLAKAGSGDTLTGIIAGLLAQRMEPEQAATVGAYLHGALAEEVAENNATRSMVASDLILELPWLLKKFEAQ